MMTPEQIAAMRADANAGTPGPWSWNAHGDVGPTSDADDQSWGMICDPVAVDASPANRVRIARVPDMEATIIAQAAEIARLTEMLTVQWEGIPWRDGPPPAEWRDGREVLVWTDGASVVQSDGQRWWNDESWSYDSGITNHAAVTLPHEKGQPG